jgi:hypothetical protein
MLAAMALLVASLLVSASPARAADVGDGLLACSVGEICLKRHYDTQWESQIKHFWYDDLNHDNNVWYGTSIIVGEEASMYWNRDTACDVYVLDYKPLIGLYAWLQMYQNGSTWYWYAGTYGWNDRNDGHRRCAPQ